MTGVALAVGLFASITFFVDGSAARMTERAIAPVTIDMQATLTAPLASPLTLTETTGLTAPAASGQALTVTMSATNNSDRPMTAVVVKDQVLTQLAYTPGSTVMDGRPVPDVSGQSPLATGIAIGGLPAGGGVKITYRAQALSALPSPAALAFKGSIASAEEPAPSLANAAKSPTLAQLRQRVLAVSGITGADQLASVDLPPGSLRLGTASLAQPLRVFAFTPAYLRHYPMVRLTSGAFDGSTALLSADAAAGIGASPGSGPAQTVSLLVPGRATPINLGVGGSADFSKADALFASRSPDTQGEFAQVANVIVVPLTVFENQVLPALRVDASAPSTVLKAAPVMELDLHVDRARLAADPTVAAITTEGLKRSVERTFPGRVSAIDNLTDTLNSVRGDTILAKVLFLFLGLPGVLLAAYLSRYAGGLLSQAQRRERATLSARGAQPAHLVRALTYTTVAISLLGSITGLGLGLLLVALVLGPQALRTASPESFVLSAGLSLLAGGLTTALALYLPARRAMLAETGEERRELQVTATPAWLRLRLDLVLIAAAAVVWVVTNLSGGFKPTAAEGQTVSLSFYTLLAPLLGWLGVTLLAVRVLLFAGGRLSRRRSSSFGSLVGGTLRRSVQRRPLALASGLLAVALAVAFGSSVVVLAATYDAEKQADARFVVGSDLRVTPSTLVPQTGAFAARLQVPGVTAVAPVAQTSAIVGTDKRTLIAIDPASFGAAASFPDSFLVGSTGAQAMAALRNDPAAILVSVELARTFNVQPGDQVNMTLPGPGGTGSVPVTMHAAALFKNFPAYPQGTDLVANLAYVQTVTGSQKIDLFLLRAADPSSAGVAKIAAAVTQASGRSAPVLVDTTATAINRDASSLAAVNMHGLGNLEAVFTILMSSAGIAIFVFGLLLQRRKEYVTMRALGIRMAQLRLLVLGEASAVAALSLVVGGAVGCAMALMFVQILSPIFTIPPDSVTLPGGELLLLGGLVLGGMAASVMVASRIIRRLNPVELLREE